MADLEEAVHGFKEFIIMAEEEKIFLFGKYQMLYEVMFKQNRLPLLPES